MRILIITDQFPPAEFGGMAQHAVHMARYLSQRHEVLVATLRGHDPSVHAKNCNRIVSPLCETTKITVGP